MSTSANLSGHIIRSHEDSKPPGHLLHQPGLKQQPQRPHRPPGQQAESSRAIHSGSSHQSVRYTSMNATSNGYQAQGSHHHHQQQHQQPPYAGPAEGWMANHGVPWWMVPPPNVSTVTPWSEEKIDELQDRLRLKLGPEFITQRPGPGGGPKLRYVVGTYAGLRQPSKLTHTAISRDGNVRDGVSGSTAGILDELTAEPCSHRPCQ